MSEEQEKKDGISRRNFLLGITGVVGGLGGAIGAWPFVKALRPTKDLIAAGVMEVDVSDISEGEMKTVIWRKQPVIIIKRNKEMIESTRKVDVDSLKDPATVEDRVYDEKLYVSIGICTHLGCIPKFMPEGVEGIDMPGFYCPCHGGKYDTVGRRQAGPPPENFHLLPYKYDEAKQVVTIGTDTFAGFGENVRKLKDLPERA